MTPDLLARYGRALTGSPDRWRRPLAALLGVDPRTVRRWAAPGGTIPPEVESELAELARRRREELEGL